PVREIDVLLQRDGRLCPGEVVINTVLEHDPDEGQSVERGRANHLDPGCDGQADLDGNGVVPLHLFCGQAGRLGRDLEDDGGGVRVRLDVDLGECPQTTTDQHDQAQHHDGAAR